MVEIQAADRVHVLRRAGRRAHRQDPIFTAKTSVDTQARRDDQVSFDVETRHESRDRVRNEVEEVAARKWPIVVHPDAMHTPSDWNRLGECLCIENMDKRKAVGQTAQGLARYFNLLPKASLCFDIGHARQVDPTMSEAAAILRSFRGRIQQLHVSEVNTQSKHGALSLESILAFQKVSHLVPADCPAILESRVEEAQIEEEIQSVLRSLSTESLLALTGD